VQSAAIAESALFSSSAPRRDGVLWSISDWLQTDAARDTAGTILDVVLGLCVSDAPETRGAAIYAISRFFLTHVGAYPTIRTRALRIISTLAERDLSWSVRVRALDSLAYFCVTSEERAAVDQAISAMGDSLVALERRVRAVVRRRIARTEGLAP
jgi:hypothetical protein